MKYSIDEILEIVKRDGDFEYDLLEMGKIWGYRSLRFNFHRRFKYDFETGKLYHRYTTNSRNKVGAEVGSITYDGYLRTYFNKKEFRLHRVIMIMFNDDFDDSLQVDHQNGKRDDNRLKNLRMVTPQDNAKNKKLSKSNKTGYVGIQLYDNSKYCVQCKVSGRILQGGIYTSIEDAIKARDELYAKHGFHPNHGRLQRTL